MAELSKRSTLTVFDLNRAPVFTLLLPVSVLGNTSGFIVAGHYHVQRMYVESGLLGSMKKAFLKVEVY